MALIDSEGFGMSTAGQDFVDHGVILAATAPTIFAAGIMGDNYARFTAATNARRMFLASATTWFCGFRALPGAVNSNASGFSFVDSGGTPQFTVQIGLTGIVTVASGAWNGTVLGTSGTPGTLPLHVWSYVEVGAAISTSAGSVTIRVNGATVLNLSGVNNQAAAAASTQGILFGPAFSSDSIGVAHLYFCDATGSAPWNSYLGDVRVQSLFPIANDAVAFAPNGLPTNWQNGAKVPPVPLTDFNSSSNVGDQDTFVLQPVAATLGQIFGVHVKPLLGKSDAGARSGACVLKSGGTTDVGTSTTLAAAATALQVKKVYQTDPNTGAQWTLANATAIKAGYKVTA